MLITIRLHITHTHTHTSNYQKCYPRNYIVVYMILWLCTYVLNRKCSPLILCIYKSTGGEELNMEGRGLMGWYLDNAILYYIYMYKDSAKSLSIC